MPEGKDKLERYGDAAGLVAIALAEGLEPDPRLTVSEWADSYRIVSATNSTPGQWKTSKTPYLREIMDSLSPRSDVSEVVFMKGAQVGGTECIHNFLGYVIDLMPGPIMIVQPTDIVAKKYSKLKIEPLIRDTPRLRAKVREARSRDSGNTTLLKEFPGGSLIITGSNSAIGLRSFNVRFLLCDEVDAYVGDVEGEGDPIELAGARMRTMSRTKRILVSTPTLEGRSRIKAAFLETDQRKFHVPCPLCGELQPLEWKSMQWDKNDPSSVRYRCAKCDGEFSDAGKTAMLAGGKWVASATCPAGRRGYHLSSLYSPLGWYSWRDAVQQFLDARGQPAKLKTFINTTLGETWQERGDAPEWERIYTRREAYDMGTCPAGVLFLTAGVDVQGDRLEVEIVGWGRGLESWSVEYMVLEGSSDEPSTWKKLAALFGESWQHELGPRLAVRIFAIDSSYNSQVVYAQARKLPPERTMVVKGLESPTLLGLPNRIDVSTKGRKIRRGCKLWPVGVGVAKTELYGWLRLQPPLEKTDPFPPGWCHFPEYAEEYFKQLTAEELVTHLVRGYRKTIWEKRRERNEALDCRVYARAAAALFGVDRFDDDAWAAVEESLTVAPEVGERHTREEPEERETPEPGAAPRAYQGFWNKDRWRSPPPT